MAHAFSTHQATAIPTCVTGVTRTTATTGNNGTILKTM
jgi:hypothetical protein